ncbi:MAG: DUF2321 domain-containing protein [Candidatus Dormibacteria bacterium]
MSWNPQRSRPPTLPDGKNYLAAICRRGHIEASILSGPVAPRCGRCGAEVLTACPSCISPLRGSRVGVVGPPGAPNGFCWSCGNPYPWATREAIVYHIENLLAGDDALSEGDVRALREQMASLNQVPSSGTTVEREQVAALRSLRTLAPKIWDRAAPLVTAIATAEIKRQLGLPPV